MERARAPPLVCCARAGRLGTPRRTGAPGGGQRTSAELFLLIVQPQERVQGRRARQVERAQGVFDRGRWRRGRRRRGRLEQAELSAPVCAAGGKRGTPCLVDR